MNRNSKIILIPRIFFKTVYLVIFSFILFFVRIISKLFSKKEKAEVVKEINKKESKSVYNKFRVVDKKLGDYNGFEDKLNNESKIILVFGKRGGGKSGLGFKLMENIFSRTERKCYVLGVEDKFLPSWIKSVEDVSEVEENSVLLIDEGAVSFSSRESMKSKNKDISKLMAVARHKDLTLIFLTQNTGMIDKNILKLSDSMIVKEGSLLQIEMERPEIKKFYEKANKSFKEIKDDKRKYSYIIDSDFEGLVEQSLPSFWNVKISKNQGKGN